MIHKSSNNTVSSTPGLLAQGVNPQYIRYQAHNIMSITLASQLYIYIYSQLQVLASILNIQLRFADDFTLLSNADTNTSVSFKGPVRTDLLPPACLYCGRIVGGQLYTPYHRFRSAGKLYPVSSIYDIRRCALHLGRWSVRCISAHVQQPSLLNIDLSLTVREQQVQTSNTISSAKYNAVRSVS